MENNAYDFFKSKERMDEKTIIDKLLKDSFNGDTTSFLKYWEEIKSEAEEKLNESKEGNLEANEILKTYDLVKFATKAILYAQDLQKSNQAIAFEQLENDIKSNYERQIEIINEKRNLANRFASILEDEGISQSEKADTLRGLNQSFNDLDVENEKIKATIEEKVIQLNNIDSNFNLSELKPTSFPYLGYDETEDIYKRIIKGKNSINSNDNSFKQNMLDSIELMANINLRTIHAETFNYDKMIEQVEKDLSNENVNVQSETPSTEENNDTPNDDNIVQNVSTGSQINPVSEQVNSESNETEVTITEDNLVEFLIERINNNEIQYKHRYTYDDAKKDEKLKSIIEKLCSQKILLSSGGSSFNNERTDIYNIKYKKVKDFINNYQGNIINEEEKQSLQPKIDELLYEEIKKWTSIVGNNNADKIQEIFNITPEEAQKISERISNEQTNTNEPVEEQIISPTETASTAVEPSAPETNTIQPNPVSPNVINDSKLQAAIEQYKSIVAIINSLVASVNMINREEYALLSDAKNDMSVYVSKEQEAASLSNQIFDKKLELSKLEYEFYNNNKYALSLNNEISAIKIDEIETNDEFYSFVNSHNEIIDANYVAVKNLTSQVKNSDENMKNAIITEIDKHMAIIDMEKSIISRRAILEKEKNKSFDIINFYKENNYTNRMKKSNNENVNIEPEITEINNVEPTISIESEVTETNNVDQTPNVEVTPETGKNIIKVHKSSLNFNGPQKVNTLKASITRGNLITIKILKDAIRIEYNKYLVDKLNELKLQVQTVASYNQEGQKNINIGELQNAQNGKQIQMINNPQDLANATINFVDENNQVVADYNIYENPAIQDAVNGMSK